MAIGLGLSLMGDASGEEKVRRAVGTGEKLERIIIPRVDMTSAPLADALELLRIRSEDLDPTMPAGKPGRGLNFVLKDPDGDLADKEISLTLTRVPLKTVLDYITRFTRVTYRVDGSAVVVGKPEHLGGMAGMVPPGRLGANGRRLFGRLRDTVLPEVSIQDATLDEAIDFFRAVSAPSSKRAGEPGSGGLNFVLKNPEEPLPRITLHLRQVPLGTALRYACELSGVVYSVHPNVVAIGSPEEMIPKPVDPGAHAYGRSGIQTGGAILAARLKALRVPQVRLSSASLNDALDLVRAAAQNAEKEAGVAEPKGINIVNLAQDNVQRITLNLENIPAWELMSYISSLTDTEFRVEAQAVLLDWKLPRKVKQVADEKEAEKPAGGVLEVPVVPDFDGGKPQVLQVPVLNRDNPFSIIPDERQKPLVVPNW